MNKPSKAILNNEVKMNVYLKAYEQYEADRAVATKYMLADKITALPMRPDGSAYVAVTNQGDCASNGALGRYKKAVGGAELHLPA